MTYDLNGCTVALATFRVMPGGQAKALTGSPRYTALFSFSCVHSHYHTFVHVDAIACVRTGHPEAALEA